MLWSLLLLLVPVGHRLLTSSQGTLYPYGAAVKDRSAGLKFFRRIPITLPRNINFMGQQGNDIKASTRGEIKFENAVFRVFGNPLASFDLQANSQSQMYYRMTTDAAFLTALSTEISTVYGKLNSIFVAREAVVVTWTNVTVPNGNDSTPVNSMQAVVVSGTKETFMIINYEEINWVGYDEYSDQPIKIFMHVETLGFGTFVSFKLPGSQDPDLKEQLSVGNSGTPYRWILRVDLCETCLAIPKGVCLASAVDDDVTQCFCEEYYRGALCHIDIRLIDECASNPCVRGVCVDQYNAFLCQCPAGYQGMLCEVAITGGTPGDWAVWGECSKACDSGVSTRVRQCLVAPCLEPNIQYQVCEMAKCFDDDKELAHSVLLQTHKSLLEVGLQEASFRRVIASIITSWCTNAGNKCCSRYEKSAFLFFRGNVTADNVKIVSGFPIMSTKGQVMIRAVVFMSAPRLRAACGLPPVTRRKRHLDTDEAIFFPTDLLLEALRIYRKILNDAATLCCYEAVEEFVPIPDQFWKVLLGSLIPIAVAILGILAFVLYQIIQMKNQKQATQNYKSSVKPEPSDVLEMTPAKEASVSKEPAAAQGRALRYTPAVRIYPAYAWTRL